MKRLLLLLPLGAALGLLAVGPRAAGQPGDNFGVLNTNPAPATPRLPAGIVPDRPGRAEAPAAANPFPLTAEAGEWLICAAHYQGPNGPDLSRQVCGELRDRHHLQAFIYNRGAEERRKQEEEWEKLKQQMHGAPVRRRTVRIPDTYAVLVGGFRDQNAASDYLPRIRALPLPQLKLEGNSDLKPYDLMIQEEVDPRTKKKVQRWAPVNPFLAAMVVRNPLVPHTGPAKPRWDPFWKQLNADEEYSLLKNPKQYTLLVKEYLGTRTIQQQPVKSSPFLDLIGLGGSKSGEGLMGCAMQAHELARFLRLPQLGFRSYVLHTRTSSIVTVGEFSGPDDPELERLQRQLANLRFGTRNGQDDPIGLLPTPLPIEVPRP
jgi:hypothetical protein